MATYNGRLRADVALADCVKLARSEMSLLVTEIPLVLLHHQGYNDRDDLRSKINREHEQIVVTLIRVLQHLRNASITEFLSWYQKGFTA